MRRYYPSLLVLRGRPKRRVFRLRTASANNRVRDQRLEQAEWEIDKLKRMWSSMLSHSAITSTVWQSLTILQQEYRIQDTQIALNREEIAGLRAREVPIMNRQKKEEALQLLSGFAEEAHDLREGMRVLRADADALDARVANLERALGEAPDA